MEGDVCVGGGKWGGVILSTDALLGLSPIGIDHMVCNGGLLFLLCPDTSSPLHALLNSTQLFQLF